MPLRVSKKSPEHYLDVQGSFYLLRLKPDSIGSTVPIFLAGSAAVAAY